MILLNDMLQQTHNKDFLHYFARINCRTCYYFRKERKDLEYNVIINDKYH